MKDVIDRQAVYRKLHDFAAFWKGRIDSWRDEGTTKGTETRHAQQFWTDLLRCFDIKPERIDVFERNASRASTGGRGRIDFFWSGLVIGEAKSLDGKETVDDAHSQALDYLNGGDVSSHEWPKYVITTDFESFRLDRLGDKPWTIRFSIEEVPEHLEQLIFFAGVDTLTKREQEEASIEAAKIMARLFTTLVGEEVDEEVGDDAPTTAEDEDDDVERASVLMTRLLFLLYGDDAGLWEEDLFYRWLESVSPTNIGPALDGLFDLLNESAEQRRKKYRGNLPALASRFPHVNGGVFDGTGRVGYSAPPELREVLIDAARFRWTTISPAIFGAMFQLVKKKEARRGDGEHYTSETNILKTLDPLFLDEYRKEADRLIADTTQTGPLRRLQEEISSNIYVDPACGAGNFLNVAYAQLREIETDLIVERRRREGATTGAIDATMDQLLTIDKFFGFELNWWPAKIAETAMFLVDHQANRDLAARTGQAPERLPITLTAKITHGNALRLDWSKELPIPTGKTFIFGNPPFLGHYTRNSEQADDLNTAWGEDVSGRLDYVTGWHAKAKDLLATRPGEFAYVATNSITQGLPVPALFAPLYREGWKIKFAHRTFAWDSEAPGKAAVHCVIVGFTKNQSSRQQLWDYPDVHGEPVPQRVTTGVNAYLIDGPNLMVKTTTKPLSPTILPVRYGSMPADGGNLVFKAKEGKRGFDQDPVAAKYLRRFVGTSELIHGTERWCLWLEDLTQADLKQSKQLREAIESCRQWRSQQKDTGDAYGLQHIPHLFRPSRHVPRKPYLCIPRHVTANRRYWTASRLEPDVICGDAAFLAPDEDGLLFALISSSMFITWLRTIGGRIKSDLRFANTLVWNTFPAPVLEETARDRIIEAGKQVVTARAERPDQSLSELYDPLLMGANKSLQKAHNVLDAEVDKAFGAARRLQSEKQRLELLFPAYQELVAPRK